LGQKRILANAQHEEGDRCRARALVPPTMPCALSNHEITNGQMGRRTIVQLEPKIAVENDRVVESLGLVHLGAVMLECIREPGQSFEILPTGGGSVGRLTGSGRLRGERYDV
jgi:hypothetical protein